MVVVVYRAFLEQLVSREILEILDNKDKRDPEDNKDSRALKEEM